MMFGAKQSRTEKKNNRRKEIRAARRAVSFTGSVETIKTFNPVVRLNPAQSDVFDLCTNNLWLQIMRGPKEEKRTMRFSFPSEEIAAEKGFRKYYGALQSIGENNQMRPICAALHKVLELVESVGCESYFGRSYPFLGEQTCDYYSASISALHYTSTVHAYIQTPSQSYVVYLSSEKPHRGGYRPGLQKKIFLQFNAFDEGIDVGENNSAI